MLCEKCGNIIFKRLADAEGLDVHYMFYEQHQNQKALKANKDVCHLCRKIWCALEREWCEQGRMNCKFEDSKPAPIRFRILLKDQWILGDDLEGILDAEIFVVECGHLEIYNRFSNSMSDELSNIVNSRPAIMSPKAHMRSDPTTVSEGNIQLARFWLKSCSEGHEVCQHLNQAPKLPLRVLDVTNSDEVRLVSGGGNRGGYTCLSYKWGTESKYLLTSENLSDLQNGISTHILPRTFSDAVRLAHDLGFTYLWVDALCIKQDSPEEVGEQIGLMDDIFRGSSLTFFAAASMSAQAGISTARDPVIVQPTKVHFTFMNGSWEWNKPFFVSKFMSSLNLRGKLRQLPLFQRGWVLQEEILSNRALIFVERELWWRCNYGEGSEGQPECIENRGYGSRIGDDFGNFRSWLQGRDPLAAEFRLPQTNERLGILDEWYLTVENYSGRKLTFDSDIVPALSGLASAVYKMRGYTYLAGLWAEDIQLGLLWRTDDSSTGDGAARTPENEKKSLRRFRPCQEHAGMRDRICYCQCSKEMSGGGPSWSWTSQFATARRIKFEHDRRYIRTQRFGIQLVNTSIIQPSSGVPDSHGKIVSATLTVIACVKWGTAYAPALNEAQQTFGRLYDINHGPDTSECLAEFWPDDPTQTYDENGKLEVLCVLCAVAPWQVDMTKKGKTAITAIGVLPVANRPGRYQRVGLIMFYYGHEDWFGHRKLTLEKMMPDSPFGFRRVCEPADGASMATLELV